MSARQFFTAACEYFCRWATGLAICGSVSAMALSPAMPALGQEAVPAAPDRPLIVPLPETVVSDEDVEVTLKGPLHEAFARTVTLDPMPGPRVDRQPPEPIDEVPPDVQPEGDNVVWIPGYWSWDDSENDFLWISGLWRDMPPGRRWVPGYWAPDGNAWQWYSGFWAGAEQESVNYLPQPPGNLDLGPTSPAPSDNYFWIPGCWQYSGLAYNWRPGYWAPFVNDWVWVPSSYCATPRGYVYCDGYWDYRLSRRGTCFASLRFHRYGHYDYRPSYVLNPSSLLLHLFVDSRTGCYLYGDWYGHRAAMPWYATNRQHRCYDPILTYNCWTYGSGYTTRLAGWTSWFHSHPDHRPRHSLRDQDAFASRHRNQSWLNQAVIGTSLSRALSDGDRHGHRFQRVDESSRRRATEWSRGIAQLRTDRERTEAGHGRSGDAHTPGLAVAGNRGRESGGHSRTNGDHGHSELKLPKLSPEMRGNLSRDVSSLPRFGDRSPGSSGFRADGRSGDFSGRFGNPSDRSRGTAVVESPVSGRPTVEFRRPESSDRPPGNLIVRPEIRSGARHRETESPARSVLRPEGGLNDRIGQSVDNNSRLSGNNPFNGKFGQFSGSRPGGSSGPQPSSRESRGESDSASRSSSGSKGRSPSTSLGGLQSGGSSVIVPRGDSGDRPSGISSGTPVFHKRATAGSSSSASHSSSIPSSGSSSSPPVNMRTPKSGFSQAASGGGFGSASRSSRSRSSEAGSSRSSGGSFGKTLNQSVNRSQSSTPSANLSRGTSSGSSSRASSSSNRRSSSSTTPKSGFITGRK
jgi:hypothetical protein